MVAAEWWCADRIQHFLNVRSVECFGFLKKLVKSLFKTTLIEFSFKRLKPTAVNKQFY